MPVTEGSSTSPSLIDRARRLDADAWRRLCEVYGPVVYRWARLKGLQASDAADVGQEVFRTVAAKIGEFHSDRPGNTFRGWLWTITHHKLGDYFRARARVPQAAGGSTANRQFNALADGDSLEPPADDDSQREIMHRTLALIRVEFEAKTWRAFWQTTMEGRPNDLVADELGMSLHAIRQAKHRVLHRLRDEMRDEGVL